jgi:hypothetical protein
MGNIVQRLGALLLYGGSLVLRPYERQCIDSWVESLPSSARAIMAAQLVRLDLYKRLNRGRILRLFPTGWPNGTPLPSELRLSLQEDESRVAKAKIVFAEKPEVVCDVIVVMQHGQLTSLEFSRLPPRPSGMRSEIRSIQHLRDVCMASAPERAVRLGATLPSKFQWLAEYPGMELSDPRPREEVREFLASFGTKFPDEYAELLGKTNGLSAGPVTIYGLGDAWTVPRPDGPFVVLANITDIGDFACKADDGTGAIFLLDSESDQVTPLSHSLSESLSKLSREFDSSRSA